MGRLRTTAVIGVGFLFATSLPAFAQNVVQGAYPVTFCRFSQFATCPASGACPAPPDQVVPPTEYPVYHLDDHKFSPDNRDFPSTGYPITMLCPVTRAAVDGDSSIRAEAAILRPDLGDLRCTLYSISSFGLITAMSTAGGEFAQGAPRHDVLGMSIPAGTNTGGTQYQLQCAFPGGAGNSAAYLYNYRTSEIATALQPVTTYPASVCVPRASSATTGPTLGGDNGKLRYFVGAAQNTDAGNLNVECPMIDTSDYGTFHPVDAYLTEATGTSHSSCSLVVRFSMSTTVVDTFPATPAISAAGPVHLFMNANKSYIDKMRFTVECTLSPGSSINSIDLSR